MKQAIALTSACAIFLMPVQSAIAADTNAPVGLSPASSIEVVSTPSSTIMQGASAAARVPVEISSDSAVSAETQNISLPKAPPQPSEAALSLDTPGGSAMAIPQPSVPSSAQASSTAAVTPPSLQPSAPVSDVDLSPARITSNAPPASDKAEIVSVLPAQTAKELQEQYRGTPGMISSHGEQPISEGPEQCVAAGQCGNRNAIGFSMMAWGAALAGLIGLIVWIGKAGPDPCCGSDSSCCR
jgi:hypothetical protein